MLPESSKGIKPETKENIVQKTDKRRNSLTDSSSFSTSTSSTSSSAESDEAINWLGTLRETKGTMTVPAEVLSNSDEVDTKSGLNKLRRVVRTDNSPAEEFRRTMGFKSLADDHPVNDKVENVEDEKGVKHIAQTKKRADKTRKEREKKEKLERERAAYLQKRMKDYEVNKQTLLFECEKERCLREVVRCTQRRGQYNLGPVHYGTNSIMTSIHSHGKTPIEKVRAAKEEEKLRACVGFGIAATGIYDYLPRIANSRNVKPIYYSEIVGAHKENWREAYQDSYLKEHNHIGPLYVEKDALEGVAKSMELVASMFDSVLSNKWLRKLLLYVLQGQVQKVWRRLQIIVEVLSGYEAGNHYYKALGLPAMLEHIMQSVVNLTRDREKNTNVVMYLSSQFAGRKPCFLEKHRHCLMVDLILCCLTPLNAQILLNEKTIDCQRKAIHFAAISGQPCQLDVLLKHGTNTNDFDQSKQAPIHYLVERNNVLMVRQLMWYGADLSLVEPSTSRIPSELYNVDNGEQKLLLSLRKDVVKSLSDDEQLVVFMLPIAFTPQDCLMPAGYPHIVRTEMCETVFSDFKQPISLMQTPTLVVS
uniref:ANK_REP_REGION domain-containing protein n=1 Tax=Angiostrongylus cantonensis TaxID=6313 RepID=A0A158PC38_ANGCA